MNARAERADDYSWFKAMAFIKPFLATERHYRQLTRAYIMSLIAEKS